jgi:glycosyltransferase involved in cell wall biosynthesis
VKLVSVIVPVHGAAASLGACLAHLEQQTYAAREIILVDNGCDAIPAGMKVVRETRPGSFAARNAGVRAASGAVLAFTDADCFPRRDWLARGVASLGEAEILAGGIDLVAPRPAGVSPTAYLYSAILSLHPDGFAHAGGLGATANLFVPRAVMDAVGPFAEDLLSGGDMEWGRRARERGFPSRYDPTVRVTHEARATVAAIIRRELRLAGGNQMNRQRRLSEGLVRFLMHIANFELRHDLRWALGAVWAADISAGERARVASLVVAVQALRVAERIRIYFGGAPRRA